MHPCLKCGKPIHRRSIYCTHCWQLGRKIPKSTKIKRRNTLRKKYGKNLPGIFKIGHKIKPGNSFKVGNIPWNKGKSMLCNRGNKHGNWKGGISPVIIMIRELPQNKEWMKKIFKRDKYTCQICRKISKDKIKIDAHHLKRFVDILREMLEKYKLNINRDKRKIIKIAKSYKPFWDINNGITLCRECHKDVTFRHKEIDVRKAA